MFSSSEKENWIEQFHKIQQFYNIPNDVNMAFGDNRLTINLSNDAHISILKIEKQGRVCLLEDFISKSNNDRVIEIVTPIYRKAKSNEKSLMIPKIYISDWKLKGNGFQYICILMKAIKMNFNSIYITVFKRTFDNNHLESFFFIKYRK